MPSVVRDRTEACGARCVQVAPSPPLPSPPLSALLHCQLEVKHMEDAVKTSSKALHLAKKAAPQRTAEIVRLLVCTYNAREHTHTPLLYLTPHPHPTHTPPTPLMCFILSVCMYTYVRM